MILDFTFGADLFCFHAQGLVQDGKMFDIALLDKFYIYEPNMISDELYQIDEDIKHAYLMFIGVLVPVVSFSWRSYIKHYVKDSSKPTYVKNNLTISDEAYTIWLIKQHLPNTINEHNNTQQITTTKKRKGQHITKTYMNEYNNEFHKINQMRNVKNDESHIAFLHFEKMFFNCFFDNNGPIFAYSNTLNKTNMANHSTIFIESLDEDEPATPIKDHITEQV